MNNKQFESLTSRIEKVIMSCKSNDHLETAKHWAYDVYKRTPMRFEDELFFERIFIDAPVRRQKEYLKRLEALK